MQLELKAPKCEKKIAKQLDKATWDVRVGAIDLFG